MAKKVRNSIKNYGLILFYTGKLGFYHKIYNILIFLNKKSRYFLGNDLDLLLSDTPIAIPPGKNTVFDQFFSGGPEGNYSHITFSLGIIKNAYFRELT